MASGAGARGKPLALIGMELLKNGFRRPVLCAAAQHGRQKITMLVPDYPLGRVDQIGARGPDAPAKVDVFAHAEVLAETSDRLIRGATDQQVAGGNVEGVRPLGPQHQVPPHVEGRSHLLVAVEPRLGVVADGPSANCGDPIPGEKRCEPAQPGPVGHAVAVNKGQ